MTEQHDGGIRGVLFDVDGTLVDTNYLHAVAWWQSFRRFGHDVPMATRSAARHRPRRGGAARRRMR